MSKEILRPQDFSRATIVEHDFAVLSDAQIKELNELYEGASAKLRQGELLTGKIINVDSNGILIDVSYKSNGLVPRYEFSEAELKELKAGDEIEVILDQVEGVDGTVLLSYEKAKALKAWDKITALFKDEQPIEGVVTHTVKGGLSVDIGVPAFLPGSQVDIQRVTNFEQYVGQKVIAEILKINKKRGNVIISRRKHLSEQRAQQRRDAMETLAEGQVIQGQVKNITNYGVFIDIGGIDGLLHITDMTWGRISHPSELVKIGEDISVKVIGIDKDNSKISLGMKQLTSNPWEKISTEVEVGSKVNGRISSITDYGMFIEIEKGVEGLIHISEISWTERISDLNRTYSVNDKVDALVVSMDKDNRRMSLSIKQLDKNPWDSIKETFNVGDKIKGTVTNITDFGVFIQIMPGIDGLAHISDLSWTDHIDHPGDLYKAGSPIDAIILGIDEDSKKISLGVKQLVQDPWESVEADYKVGSIVKGSTTKETNFGTFVKLSNRIEALVPSTEKDSDGKAVENKFEIGTEHQFRIVSVNKDERKINLSSQLEAPVMPVKEVKPKKAAPKKASSSSASSAPKQRQAPSTMKSALQLELEKLQKAKKDS